MSHFYKLLFCSLCFLISVQINFELASANESSIRESTPTSNEDEEDPIYLIKGGYRPAQHSLAKYVVSIRKRDKYGSQYFGSTHYCGGAILNPELILTAAHCLQRNARRILPSALEVVTGTPMRLVKTTHTQVIEVKNVIVHRNFDVRGIICDIGLLELKSKINLDGIYTQAIPLPRAPPVVGTSCVTMGWGHMYLNGPQANEILYLNLTILERSLCQTKFPIVVDREICAYDPVDSQKDSCQGDSGGPLICNGILTGIVSYGRGCGHGTPTVHTDVFEFLDWISKSICDKSGISPWMFCFVNLTWTIIFLL